MASTTRQSGRHNGQMRMLQSERGVLNRADGSAKWSQDNTSVLVAVYGPRQARERREDAEKAVVEVVYKPRSGLQGDEDRAREHLIRGAVEGAVQLELHPRTCIQVVVQVLQDDGGLLACVLNATCAALVDAGVPMTTMFGAVSCALSPTGAVVVDPDAAEEKEAAAVICLAFPYHHDLSVPSPAAAAAAGGSAASSSGAPVRVGTDALLSDTTGVFSREQFLAVFEVCRQGCAEVSELSRRSLARSLQLLLDGSSAAAI